MTAMRVHIRPDRDILPHSQRVEPHWGKPSSQPFEGGCRYVILRMLPVNSAVQNRADCHMWPKGTFLQINGEPVPLTQRSHNGKDWEGSSKVLDLSPYIKDASESLSLEMCCYDDEPYYFCIAVCSYRIPERILREALDPKSSLLSRLPRGAGLQQAKQRLQSSCLSVDDDDDDVCAETRFTFSLLCPISKQVIRHPVRGKNCQHWQVRDFAKLKEAFEKVWLSSLHCSPLAVL
jgi:hypothetical protein